MSEQRFFVETVAVREKVITDKDNFYSYEDLDEIVAILNEQQATINSLTEKNEQLRFLLDINSVSERKKLEKQCDEQQATICKLQDLCGESDGENAKLRQEIKKLKEEEKLYAQEILRLNELLKQYQSFKDLGGDY